MAYIYRHKIVAITAFYNGFRSNGTFDFVPTAVFVNEDWINKGTDQGRVKN